MTAEGNTFSGKISGIVISEEGCERDIPKFLSEKRGKNRCPALSTELLLKVLLLSHLTSCH